MAKTDTENLPSKAAVLEAAQNQLLAVAKFTVKFNADFAVKDDAQAQAVGADLKVIKSALNSIEDERKKFTKPLDELKKFFMDGFRPAENALKTAEVIAKRALLEYQQELARAARAAIEKQEAAKRAEMERLRQEQLEAEIVEDLEAANEAKTALETAKALPAIALAPEPQKIDGVHTVKVWKADVTDLAALVKYIAESGKHLNLVEPNSKDIAALAKATKGTLEIPGIAFYCEDSLAVRS